jgi:hypothetical protein
MHPSLFVRLKSIFARDKYAFWWKEATDREKEFTQMDAWDLAQVMCGNNAADKIVAEHFLNLRLARIQADATKRSSWFALFGALATAVLTFYLGQLSVKSTEVICTVRYQAEQHPKEKAEPVPKLAPVQPSPEPEAMQPHERNTNDKKSSPTGRP